MSDRPLTPKQQLFVKEYLKDLNASRAARSAGYSLRTADRQAHDLLKKPEIAAAVQKEMDKRSQRTEITADYVLTGIKSVIESATRETDRLKGYELLGKHLKLFTDRQEIAGHGGQPLQMSVELHVKKTDS